MAFLLACGLSDPEIAASLFISPRTVRSQVADILLRLDADSRVEVACAVVLLTTPLAATAQR